MGTFFSTQEDSPYSELKGAGFLLAVAFKIDTKIPPDKIPAVKDYKAMMKDLEGLKGVSVKKPEAAQAAYAKAKASTRPTLTLTLTLALTLTLTLTLSPTLTLALT